MYNLLVERCFRECVDTFRRKDLESAEEKVRPSRFGPFRVLMMFSDSAYGLEARNSTDRSPLVHSVWRIAVKSS